jgi:hypothetical protein
MKKICQLYKNENKWSKTISNISNFIELLYLVAWKDQLFPKRYVIVMDKIYLIIESAFSRQFSCLLENKRYDLQLFST